MNPLSAWRARRARMKVAEAALQKTERLAEVVDFQSAEATHISDWAHDRLAKNHLTRLFERTIRER